MTITAAIVNGTRMAVGVWDEKVAWTVAACRESGEWRPEDIRLQP